MQGALFGDLVIADDVDGDVVVDVAENIEVDGVLMMSFRPILLLLAFLIIATVQSSSPKRR